MLRTIGVLATNFIGVISGVLGIYQAGNLYWKSWIKIPETAIAVVFVCLIAVYYFIMYVFRSATMEKKTRYADALSSINGGLEVLNAVNRLHGPIERELDPNSKQQVLTHFEGLCDSFADAFKLITSSECAVSIKILEKIRDENNESQLVVRTLCRSRNSSGRRNKDNYARTKNIHHTLNSNTAYRDALGSPHGYYFNNYLPFDYEYNSTNFEVENRRPHRTNPIMRWHNWPLSYKSGIVTSIMPADGIGIHDLPQSSIGFLCVDSTQMGVFHRKYDLNILQGASKAIFNSLERFKNIL